MFSLYKLVDTVIESNLAVLPVGVAYSRLGLVLGSWTSGLFVFALLGGLIRNIVTREEICGYCMILLSKYLIYAIFNNCVDLTFE